MRELQYWLRTSLHKTILLTLVPFTHCSTFFRLLEGEKQKKNSERTLIHDSVYIGAFNTNNFSFFF